MKSKTLRALTAGALIALVAPAGGRGAEAATTNEQFHYHWQLRNILGTLVGLFFPRQGEGELTFKTEQNGHLWSELLITSPDSREGEYWRYGSEIDIRTLQPVRAWSSYFWRGRARAKNDPIEEKGVMDIVSGIYSIRHKPPDRPTSMEIWSDGKVYPVEVFPRGPEVRLLGDRRVDTRHFAIRGRDVPGARQWKGKLDIWLADDAAATPVEINISRDLADVHLQMLPAAAPAPVAPSH
ncbi:MAG: DUF3108 domain-containing protein [Acidobacteriota bacterium]|nr:DUF3108 domain-containing protein [Acidobacteriota bacterium]